jgi:hydrogenase nickel incorporation protein HypA/HybF
MHELSVTQNILSIAVEKAKAAGSNKVTGISIVIGELSGIVDESVQFYFELIRKDTIAAEASLSFDRKPTLLKCRTCGTTYPPKELDWNCPLCKEQNAEIISGRECYVESIEVE